MRHGRRPEPGKCRDVRVRTPTSRERGRQRQDQPTRQGQTRGDARSKAQAQGHEQAAPADPPGPRGQRRYLPPPGRDEAWCSGRTGGRSPAPGVVAFKDGGTNRLLVHQGHDSPWLQSTRLDSEPAHWVGGAPPASEFQCTAKTRYRQRDEACRVFVGDGGGVRVDFERPQRAVTPGQSVVFYREDECLGGAVIASTNAGQDAQVPRRAGCPGAAAGAQARAGRAA